MKQRWFIDQKKHHVASWRASGLTRQPYCELNNIPYTSFREWPQGIAKAERRACEPIVLPVHITEAPPPAEPFSPVVNEPITLFLPGGIRMCCYPSQLTDAFRGLKYADA